jgi:hypothetical protein
MSIQPSSSRNDGRGGEDILSATRRGVSERLSDPYLTDHDRWVLGQFRRFLGGMVPEPDPRSPGIGEREQGPGR